MYSDDSELSGVINNPHLVYSDFRKRVLAEIEQNAIT